MVQLSACDSLDDWSTVNGTDALDTIDKQEGGASIKVTGSGAGSVFIEQTYEPFSCMNLSESDHIAFWFKTEINVALRLRVYCGTDPETGYLEWVAKFRVQVKKNNVWYKVKLYLDDYDYSEGVFLPALTEAIIIKVWESAGGGDAFWIDDIRENLHDPLKVTLGIGAGENYVSDDVLELDIWSEDTKVGRWQLLLKNLGDKWGGLLHTNDPAQLKINAVTMMNGYLDDAVNELDERGVYTNNFVVPGRDLGRDLARLYHSGVYEPDEKADDILERILIAMGSEITYNSPSTAPVVNMDHKRTYLIDWLQTIGKRVNYSGYVDLTKALHFFTLGDVLEESGIALKSIAGAMDNNILDLKKGEEIGFSIANKIELTAGSLRDHYTDGNAVDFTKGADTECVNETTIKMVGTSSIKFYNSVPAMPTITLDFSGGLYSRNALDLSKGDELSFYIRHNNASEIVLIRLQLKDADGKEIEFYRSRTAAVGSSQKGTTCGMPPDKWHKIQVSYGENIVLAVGLHMSDAWYNLPGSSGFDWSNVVELTIKACQLNIPPPPVESNLSATELYFDALSIPTVEVISLVEDAVSIAAYGVAMWWDERKDIRSIIELDAISGKSDPTGTTGEIARRKDPLQTIRVFTTGQTGTKYGGQSVTVQAPGHGIAEATKYRIVKLHHMVRKRPILKGETFVTEYDLVKHIINPVQVIDDLRHSLATDPRGAMIEMLNLTRRRVKSAEATERQDFGDTHPVLTVFYSGSGVAFPADPRDGFIFVLTADVLGPPVYYGDEGVDYQYDAGTETWIRGPMLLRRATQPPVGGEVVGDFWRNTTTNILYEWSGVGWDQIGSLNLADTPDFDAVEWPTDQLAIEAREWTGNFSLIWDDRDDDPPTDWNHFKWGKRDNEGPDPPGLDATISYATDPPTAVDINCGENQNVADGEWFVYWDENQMSGDPLKYDIQWTQDYSVASGKGKGLLAVVQVRNGDGTPPPVGTAGSPSVMPYNTYIPQMGIGSLVAHSIYSKHIAGVWITGKYYRTAIGVEPGGIAGITFDPTGLYGYGGTPVVNTFALLAASGYLETYGEGMFRILKTPGGTLIGWLDSTQYLSLDALSLRSNNCQLVLDANGDIIRIIPAGNIIFDDDFGALVPASSLGVNIGTQALKFDNIWGKVRYS